jgi:2-(1,2-epoxy-1,2-dihydrophenyl)acetyl-CoA isomerase
MAENRAESATETIAYGAISLVIDGPLATITLEDSTRLNAISPAMAEGLAAALAEVVKPRRRVRCLLLTGAGRAFCAGVNLRQEADAVSAGGGKVPALSPVETLFHPLLRRLHALPIPLVVAVNGPCVGIGVGIALAADHVVAAADAYFLVPFRSLASAPDSGLTWLLPRMVGMARARRLLLRAERLPAVTALEWGMIGEVLPADGFAEAARGVALEFAQGPTVALSEMKRLLADGLRLDLDAAMEAEARAVARTSRTRDNVAAMRLFGSKEKPVFQGE